VPPSLIGKQVLVKADRDTVTIYCKEKTVATHQRSWLRRERVESARHREEAQRHRVKHWHTQDGALLISLGEEVKTYLERLAAARVPLKKNLQRLLALHDEYGSSSLIEAIRQASAHNAYGADYIGNILYQEMTPLKLHLPVKLSQEALNRIRLEEPSLAEYDAFAIKRRKRTP
jgi:hypothetical protein